jgi:hypothetical protein
VTIKTTIALEFGNRRHRDEFLRAFQGLLFTFGNKAPKLTITLTQKTEAEFGDPFGLDLFSLGVELEASGVPTVTLTTDTPLGKALAAAEALAAASPPPSPSEVDSATTPATLGERILQTLAAQGPLTMAYLAELLTEPTFALTVELERLHEAGDVEPDDGDRWRLNAAE